MSAVDDLEDFVVAGLSKKEKAERLVTLLEERGVEVDDIFKVKSLKAWQSMHKDKEDQAVVTDLRGITLSPAWGEGPQWPVVHPADPVKIPRAKSTSRSAEGTHRVLLLPDPQIAYRLFLNSDGAPELDTTHDPAALDVALQLVKALKPDTIVNLGDFLDFPEFGKYEQDPEFQQTTQLAINTAYRFLAHQRSLAPDATIHLIEGNHDRRLPNAIRRNAMAALRVRRADSTENWPVMSVPHLLRLDELDVNYVDGYPAASVDLGSGVHAIHGQKIASSSSTAAKVVNSEAISKVFGHVHRREVHWRTIETKEGVREIFGMTPGCLCRTDGAVPSYHSSTTADGKVVETAENWQQGVGVIDMVDGEPYPFTIRIHNGMGYWGGRVYTSGGLELL